MQFIFFLLFSVFALTGCQSIHDSQVTKNNCNFVGDLRYYQSEDFETLTWKLDWKPRYPDRCIFRTDPKTLSGWYVTFTLPTTLLEQAIPQKGILEVHRKDHTRSEIYTFDFSQKAMSEKTIMLGLTTPDWQSNDACIHAWNLKIISSSGAVIGETQSYGWSHF